VVFKSKRPRRRTTGITLLLVLAVVVQLAGVQTVLAAETQPDLNIEAQSAVLIEAETGQVLYAMNKDELRPPASMAKMMSEYIILREIKAGNISWDDTVTVSRTADATGGSGALLAEGETYTVRQLFENMSIFSGNDATVALAEHIAGSEERFARMMNDAAREIGLSDGAYFINATGLDREDMSTDPASLPGETQISAHDAAKLARTLILQYPEILEFSSTTVAYLKPNDERYKMTNWNWMLEGWIGTGTDFDRLFAYEGMDGLKTGSTTRAGNNFTGTAKRGELRLISVVMGAETRNSRFNETKKLLDYGFNNYEKRIAVLPKTELPDLPVAPIKKGKVKEVPLVTAAGAEFIVTKSTKPEDIVIQAELVAEEQLVAPIELGQTLGKVTVTYVTPIGETIKKEIDLVAAEPAEKASWFTLFMRAIGDFFKNMFNGIKNLF
jgi:D-alanyl-D-alanine carboxypeptidase (penicillin-binding protein 5/6)